jgi:hypothetical protein
MKGWLLIGVTAVVVAARICAKHAVVAVLQQILWKFASLVGGWLFL